MDELLDLKADVAYLEMLFDISKNLVLEGLMDPQEFEETKKELAVAKSKLQQAIKKEKRGI